MMRPLVLAAGLILSGSAVTAQPTEEDVAAARLLYVDGQYEAALKVIVPAAEAGNANAQNILGDAYDRGNGVPMDPAVALQWFEKSAAQEFPIALHNLGVTFADDDPEKARGYYERAAEKGYGWSMNNLGRMYERGELGGEPDYETAAEWFQKAVDAGISDSMNSLGLMYIYADGVDEDLGYAFELFTMAAEAGDPLGLNNLGSMYANGYAVRQDDLAAMALYRTAAEKGNARAAINLAFDLIETDSKLADPATGWAWCLIGIALATEGERAGFEEDCDALSEGMDADTRAAGEAIVADMMP